MMRKGIKAHTAPRTANFVLKLVEQLLPFRQLLIGFGKAGIDRNPASFRIDDKGKYIPGGESSDFSPVGGLLVEVLQYRDIGIVDFVVAVDLLVIGETRQDLVIARIRKPHAVGAVHLVAIFTIAVELSFLGQGAPEKRH